MQLLILSYLHFGTAIEYPQITSKQHRKTFQKIK